MAFSALLAALLLAMGCARSEDGSPNSASGSWEGHLRRATAHREEGRLDEAAAEFGVTLDLLRESDGAPLDRATALEGLARTRILQGDLGAAESLYVTVLTTLADTVGLAHVPGTRLVSVLGTLADLNQSLGRIGQAEAHYHYSDTYRLRFLTP